jgi:CheY-like chemotaxis protein
MKSTIPIIALTADVTTVDLAKCKAVGMDDYLAKPVDEKQLYNKIVSILNKSHLDTFPQKHSDKLEDNMVTGEKTRCINLVYLNQRTKSNPKLMMEMIALYLGQVPPLVQTMKQSLADQNWSLLAASAHKMIPSFSIVGISSNYENMAKKIQELATAPEKSKEIHELVQQLEEVCLQACNELQEELNNLRS